MTSLFRAKTIGGAGPGEGFSPFRFIQGLFILAFTLIQLILVARILLDIGVIPAAGSWGEFIISTSDTLAAPVQGIGNGLAGMLGGGGLDMIAGEGLNGVMIVALAGWSVLEALVMRVVRKFSAI